MSYYEAVLGWFWENRRELSPLRRRVFLIWLRIMKGGRWGMVERQPGTSIGEILRQRRLAFGLTLKKLGAESRLHWSNIARVEKGKRRATADFLIKIAYPLGYTRYDLLVKAGFLSDKEVREYGEQRPGGNTLPAEERKAPNVKAARH